MKANNVHRIAAPLTAILIWIFADLVPGRPEVTAMAAIALWMAWWWMTEAVHLAVTSLLPFLLFPLLGIASAKDVARDYMDNIIFLFIGGFILAFAIERWNLHKRIALRILMAVGTKPANILLGVMLTSYLLSMWISNTATVMMLLAAVFALIAQVEIHVQNEKDRNKMATALLIGLAYSATIGGLATLVGTPTNMIFYRAWKDNFGTDEVNFYSWMQLGLPVSFLLLLFTWWLLNFLFIRKNERPQIDRHYFRDELKKLGPMRFEEKYVLAVFTMTALLWFTRNPIDFGAFRFKGWASLFGEYAAYIEDSTVAIFSALILFLTPSLSEKGTSLISWKEVERLPFDIILLFGGGFALASGFESSGLGTWMAGHLEGLQHLSLPVMIAVICITIALISEFASNVASIQLMIPILLALYKPLGIPPLALLIPATMAASLGFMMPVATAPNTIVYGSRRIRVKDMYRTGFWV
ncbi:MAG TPA: SLC13 family permease, partial [Bacteroidia bacterium]|nr:SLC13 family permease [Bacteroidia bacterium]